MARIHAHDMEDPCSRSRRMVGYLTRDRIPISRDRIRSRGLAPAVGSVLPVL